MLHRTGFPPSLLVLELTESVFVAEAEQLDALRRLGVDVGQGYLLGRPRSVAATGEAPAHAASEATEATEAAEAAPAA